MVMAKKQEYKKRNRITNYGGTRTGHHGSSKTHKLLVNGFNKLRSILKRELKKIWDMPVKVIPVVGALGTTPKKLKQHSN